MIEDAALWQEFAGESEDHLDTIEALLAGGGTGEREAIDRLFRAVHSLKGMSDALGVTGLKALSHRCEDLLGAARAGRVAVAGEVPKRLLEAVDEMRRQRATVLESRQDLPAPAALLAAIAALAEGRDAPAAPPAAAPPPAAPAGEGLLGTLASMLAEAAPRLGGLALAADPKAAAAAGEIAAAARELGLPRLAATLEALAEAPGGAAALPLLGKLRRQALLLAERAGEAAGAEEIARAVRPALLHLRARLAGLAPRVAALPQEGADPAAMAAIREAAAVAAALGEESLEALLHGLEDLADRPGDPDAEAQLAAQAAGLAERLGAAAAGEAVAPAALAEAGAADPRIPAEFAPMLGRDGRRRVIAALDAGRRLFRARLALGEDAPAEEAIGALLRREAEVLTSRSVLDGVPPHLELLVAAAAPEPLLQAVDAADPARRVLLDIQPIGGAERAAPVTMRVRQETIDGILSLEAEVRAAALAVGEALRDGRAGQALATLGGLEARLEGAAGRELAAAVDRLRRVQEALEGAESRLALGLRRLDDALMELRVVPVGTLFQRLPRVVRAAAAASGKEVELLLEGEDVTIDRSLVELLADPLLHLVRNAVDHGVEPPATRGAAGKPMRAQLKVSAARRTGLVRVRVSDDGRGIDRDAVLRVAVARGLVAEEAAAAMTEAEVHALLFRPGFTTREEVSETSGRGVGLDVVQEAVRRAGGTLEVTSRAGEGTSFTLRLPLTAAVQPVLLVEIGGHPYAVPEGRVEAVHEDAAEAGCAVVPLAPLLGLAPAGPGGVVVVRSGGRALGLGVDRVQRRLDLLLRPLHPALAALPGVGGVGVLGTGEPVLVLEPDGLLPDAA